MPNPLKKKLQNNLDELLELQNIQINPHSYLRRHFQECRIAFVKDPFLYKNSVKG